MKRFQVLRVNFNIKRCVLKYSLENDARQRSELTLCFLIKIQKKRVIIFLVSWTHIESKSSLCQNKILTKNFFQKRTGIPYIYNVTSMDIFRSVDLSVDLLVLIFSYFKTSQSLFFVFSLWLISLCFNKDTSIIKIKYFNY